MVARVASTSLVSNSPLRCSAQSCSSSFAERIAFIAFSFAILCPFDVCGPNALMPKLCAKSPLYSLHGSRQEIILPLHEHQPATDHVAGLHIVEGRLGSAFWI